MKKLVLLSIITLGILFLAETAAFAQTTATINLDATIRGVLILRLDGTDANGNLVPTATSAYTTAESMNLGDVDAVGTAIANGDALVNGLTGIPVTAALGTPPNGFEDTTCVGGLYQFFTTTGADDESDHANTALGIYIRGSRVNTYSLDVAASVNGDGTVTVGQLKWKNDADAVAAFNDFSAVSANITSGGAVAPRELLFHDFGLVVEFADTPATYTWTITYTLTTT